MDFNKIILMGRLVADPESKEVSVGGQGRSLTTFRLAVDRPNSEEADYFNVTAWGKLGQTIAAHKGKGEPILIEGRQAYSSWKNEEGAPRSAVSVTAESFQFLPAGKTGGHNLAILSGRLVSDPQKGQITNRATGEMVAMTTFRMAVGRKGSDKVDYLNITTFGKTAESVAAHKGQGDPVLIEGRMRNSRWTDRAGNPRSSVSTIARSLQFLPRPQKQAGEKQAA